MYVLIVCCLVTFTGRTEICGILSTPLDWANLKVGQILEKTHQWKEGDMQIHMVLEKISRKNF